MSVCGFEWGVRETSEKERERERKHIKGRREQGQVTFTQQVETQNILLKIDEVNLHIPTSLEEVRIVTPPPAPAPNYLMQFFDSFNRFSLRRRIQGGVERTG